MDPSITIFIKTLEQLATRQFPCEEVNAFLRLHHFNHNAFDGYIFYRPDRYARNLIYTCSDFEVLLLAWGPHHKSPIHGHEGEKCWMRVIDGTLRFTNYDGNEAERGNIQQTTSMDGYTGFVDGPAVIHAVENPTNMPALSLHLYARPFNQCDIFAPENGEKRKMHITYDTVDGQPV